MKGHLYQITVNYLEDNKGEAVEQAPLTFQVKNHDELLFIIEHVKAKNLFEPEEATAFALGLKLFGEVMLHHKDDALFQTLLPSFVEFMKEFKKS